MSYKVRKLIDYEEIKYDVSRFWDRLVYLFWSNPIHVIKVLKAYLPVLIKDHDYDQHFLLALLAVKLKRMYNYFNTSQIAFENSESAQEILKVLEAVERLRDEDYEHPDPKASIKEVLEYEEECFQRDLKQMSEGLQLLRGWWD